VVVDLVDGVLEDLPCPLRVLGVELHALLERLDLEVALPRWAAAAHRRRRVGFRGAGGVGGRGRTWWWTVDTQGPLRRRRTEPTGKTGGPLLGQISYQTLKKSLSSLSAP
jgi:hypothetical protein